MKEIISNSMELLMVLLFLGLVVAYLLQRSVHSKRIGKKATKEFEELRFAGYIADILKNSAPRKYQHLYKRDEVIDIVRHRFPVKKYYKEKIPLFFIATKIGKDVEQYLVRKYAA